MNGYVSQQAIRSVFDSTHFKAIIFDFGSGIDFSRRSTKIVIDEIKENLKKDNQKLVCLCLNPMTDILCSKKKKKLQQLESIGVIVCREITPISLYQKLSTILGSPNEFGNRTAIIRALKSNFAGESVVVVNRMTRVLDVQLFELMETTVAKINAQAEIDDLEKNNPYLDDTVDAKIIEVNKKTESKKNLENSKDHSQVRYKPDHSVDEKKDLSEMDQTATLKNNNTENTNPRKLSENLYSSLHCNLNLNSNMMKIDNNTNNTQYSVIPELQPLIFPVQISSQLPTLKSHSTDSRKSTKSDCHKLSSTTKNSQLQNTNTPKKCNVFKNSKFIWLKMKKEI